MEPDVLQYRLEIDYQYSEFSNLSNFGAVISGDVAGEMKYLDEACAESDSIEASAPRTCEAIVEPTELSI